MTGETNYCFFAMVEDMETGYHSNLLHVYYCLYSTAQEQVYKLLRALSSHLFVLAHASALHNTHDLVVHGCS